MRRIGTVFFGVVVAMALFIPDSSVAQPKPIVMRLAETHPQDYPTTKGDYEFARLVKERSNGRIVIEVFHSKQLGEERAVIEQVQLGAIDMTRVSISAVSVLCQRPRCLSVALSLSRCGPHVEGIEWTDWPGDFQKT